MIKNILLVLPLLLLSACATAERHAVAEDVEAQAPASTVARAGMADFNAAVAQAGGRVILSNASLRIEVDDVEDSVSKAMELARQAKGYVLSSSKRSITVRVPATGFLQLVQQYEQMGDVASKRIYGQDVTEQYVDLEARLANAEKFRKRYEALLAKAKDVKETLAVEKELERVLQQLEQIKGKLKHIQDRAALSRIDVTFDEAVTPGPLLWMGKGLYWVVEKLFIW